ncbi:hypothetical protein NECID01_0616 [Nematocida sp. AWRm77]|nr:hypothetical protein NECID01_0616 [Nematocida sp. AWRm77]
MRKLALLGMAGAALCSVTEMAVDTVGLSERNAVLYNGIKKEHGWVLKNGAAGSIVNFKNKNASHDEWSFEMDISIPNLTYPEFAGVYFWYTDDPIEQGEYKGANGRFRGLMTGIELLGQSLDIVVAANHGQHDYAGLGGDKTEMKDSPHPEIFKNQKNLVLKVISTSKNFKIEVYGENNTLLYDKFRYVSQEDLPNRVSGKFFGISTEYHEVGGSKSITLNNAKFNAREEDSTYKADISHTHMPDVIPRALHEIEPSSSEIQHTIATIEHMIKYIRIVLGEPQAKPMAETMVYMKKMINFQSAHVAELKELLLSLLEIKKRHEESDRHHRAELMRLLHEIQIHAHDHGHADTGAHSRRTAVSAVVLVGVAAFCGGYFIAANIHARKKIALH